MTDKCETCPLLAATAEAQKLLYTAGVERYGGSEMSAMIVAQLRGKYGCRGPQRYLRCPWADLAFASIHDTGLTIRGIPEIRPDPGKGPGVYL